MSAPVDVLAVMDRRVAETQKELDWLRSMIASGVVTKYEAELADLTREHNEAKQARSAAADLIAAANAVCGNTPPAGQPGHVDFGDALTMLQAALARIGGGAA